MALDELQADGVCMLTNHHGNYLGDALFDPIFAELNRRKATVFINPTKPCIIHVNNVHEDLPMRGYPPAMFEFFFEEVRVFINLLASETVKRYPDVTIIIPHAGGALPPILERFSRIGAGLPGGKVEISSKDVKDIAAGTG
jgi:predicted TIM-barrel fold metal-dependent hydrolase